VLDVEDLIGFKVQAMTNDESPKCFYYLKKYAINADKYRVHIKASNLLFYKIIILIIIWALYNINLSKKEEKLLNQRGSL